MNPGRAFIFLVETLVDLYVTALLLRLLLQWVRADFYNPLVQFLVTITNPPLLRLRRIIPAIGKLDTACVVLMLALETLSVWFRFWIEQRALEIPLILVLAVWKLLVALLITYLVLIFAAVILSWFGRRAQHPIVPLIYQLTEPVLRPIRRFLPPAGGVDLSPMVALIAIWFLLLLLGW